MRNNEKTVKSIFVGILVFVLFFYLLAKGATGHEYVFDYQEILIIVLIIITVICLSIISYADDKYSSLILKWISILTSTGILFIQIYAIIQTFYFDFGGIVGNIIFSAIQLVIIGLNIFTIIALFSNKFSVSS